MRSTLSARAAALFAFALGATLPQLSVAQDTNAAPAAAPASDEENFTRSHLRAAQTIIDVTRAGDQFDDIVPALMNQTRITFVQSTPALAREIEEVVNEVALEMAARRADLARTMQLVWARRFTEEELNELIQFFQSPVGEKFGDLTPSISALTIGAARQWEAQLASDMLNETRNRLREKGLL